MTLNVSLPDDYPLSLPTVQNERAIVSRDIQRRWLLQLTLFLTHQVSKYIGLGCLTTSACMRLKLKPRRRSSKTTSDLGLDIGLELR